MAQNVENVKISIESAFDAAGIDASEKKIDSLKKEISGSVKSIEHTVKNIDKSISDAVKHIEKTATNSVQQVEKNVTDAAEQTEKNVTDAAKQTEKNVTDAAKKTAEKSVKQASKISDGFKSLKVGVSNVTSAIGMMNAVMNGFGIVGLITTAIGFFKILKEWINKDKEAAEELALSIQNRGNEEAIERMARAYEKLNAEMKKANHEQQFRNELLTQEKSERDKTKDAQINYDEVKELNKIAYDDPDAAQKRTLIQNKYEKMRIQEHERRTRESVVSRQKTLNDSADNKDEQADKIQSKIDKDTRTENLVKQIRRAEKEYAKAKKDGKEGRVEKWGEHLRKLNGQKSRVDAEVSEQFKLIEELRKSADEDRQRANSLFGDNNGDIISSNAKIESLNKSSADAQAQMEANQKKRIEMEEELERVKDEERKRREEADFQHAAELADEEQRLEEELIRYEAKQREQWEEAERKQKEKDRKEQIKKDFAAERKKLTDRKKLIEDAAQKEARGMAADQQYHRGISGRGYQYTTDSNGRINNFTDYKRQGRYGARKDRDERNAERRNAAAQRKYDRLAEEASRRKNGRDSLSKRDQQFMNDFEKFQKSREKPGEVTLDEKLQKLDKLEDISTTLTDISADLQSALEVS